MMRLLARLLLAVAAFSLAVPAVAQQDEEGRFSFGIGGGMVDTGSETEPYFNANVRIRVGYRPDGAEREGGVVGYVEPELGYWSADALGVDRSDLLLGVNVGGAVRLRVFEYFVGAGVGYHFLDSERRVASGTIKRDDGAVGVNAHFGFDVRLSRLVSIYGVGRFDLVDQDQETGVAAASDEQVKAYLGLRFRL